MQVRKAGVVAEHIGLLGSLDCIGVDRLVKKRTPTVKVVIATRRLSAVESFVWE
jgi:hypothetical protein